MTRSTLDTVQDNRSYCRAAFESLHVAIGGAVKPCCEFEGQVGDVTETTLESVWNSAALQELRSKMHRGERDKSCRKCYDMEDAGGHSLRQIINGDHPHGDVDAPAAVLPSKLDIRFSNLCNLKCRTCGPDASSRWYSDAQELGMWKARSTALIETFGPKISALQALDPLLEEIEEINFAGGEPLLHQEQYAVVEELIKRGRTDVRLSYISNMMELGLGRKDILSLWSQFKQVLLVASVDGHKKIGELVRDGMSWDRFTQNVSKVKAACPQVQMLFNITVSVFNIHSLPSLCRSLKSIEGAADVPCIFNVLQEPHKYSIQILPADMKAAVRRELEAFALTYEGTPSQTKQAMADQVQSVLNYMVFQDRSAEIKRFRKDTLRLDHLRRQDTAATIPDLAPVLQESWLQSCLRKTQDNVTILARRAAKATIAKA